METKKTFSFFDNIDKLFHRNIKEDKVIDPPEVYTPLNDCANAILNETIIKTEKDFTMCCLTWNMHGLTPSPKEIKVSIFTQLAQKNVYEAYFKVFLFQINHIGRDNCHTISVMNI